MIAIAPRETARVRLELVRSAHAAGMLQYHAENENHLKRWEPARPPGFLTLAYWRASTEQLERDATAERSFSFIAFERDAPGVVVARINLWNVQRDVTQSAVLGYSLAARLQGRGIASEAVGSVVGFAFEELRLHRIVATYQPANERSGKLLRGLGFGIEGYARDYIFIDGKWRDSILTSKLNETGR